MIAITVSTNYDDILDIVMPHNYGFFDKWYIITHENDLKTINVIKKHNFANVVTLFYDFYENNKTFNKGGAIRYCQEIIGNTNFDGNVVILDSDICLPPIFFDVSNHTIMPDAVYGTDQRYDYYSYENFKNGVVDFIYPWSRAFQGYFQMYKYDKNKLYSESNDCSECDIAFLKFFTEQITLYNLNVAHLGRNAVNWSGRVERTDFII